MLRNLGNVKLINGELASSGTSTTTPVTAGTGITVANNVVSIDDSVVAKDTEVGAS